MARARDRALLAAIGARVKQARLDREMSQEGLAERLGVEPQSVSNVERGQHGSLSMLAAIADVLGTPLGELVDVARPVTPRPEPTREAWLAAWDDMPPERRELALRIARELAAR